MKTLWAAKDRDGQIHLFRKQPIDNGAGCWIAEDMYEMYLKDWEDELPELTFENSPQQVELELKENKLTKMSKNGNEPLFAITAEEVEMTKRALISDLTQIIDDCLRFPEIETYLVKERDKTFKFLDRIRQWKDENSKKD